jgi:hypothetical protein
MLTALPTIYDLTDPSSNLAAYDAEYGQLGQPLDGFMPAALADNRFLMGAEYVPALFAGAYGYRRHRSILPTLAWALAGYMAPLPVAGVIAYEAGTGRRAFAGLGEGDPVEPRFRCIKYAYKMVRGERKLVCVQWMVEK